MIAAIFTRNNVVYTATQYFVAANDLVRANTLDVTFGRKITTSRLGVNARAFVEILRSIISASNYDVANPVARKRG